MMPPPGFTIPIWRPWVEKEGTQLRLRKAVASIEHSLGGCHKEKVQREPTLCPSSNQHLYVKQASHTRHESNASQQRKTIKAGNL